MAQRLLLLLAGFVFYSLTTLAQAYEPGLLVRASGDTLRGEVENGFWVEPPQFIRFRPAPGSASQVFQPRELRAVLFTGGRFLRYEVLPLDHAAETRLDRLPTGNNFAPVSLDSVLADVLVEGPLTLLRVVRPGATHFLLRRAGRPTLDLSERKYLREGPRGNVLIADGNNYRGQLGLYLGDCPAAYNAAQAAPYTAAGLAAVVQTYNQTCDPARQAGRSWLAQATPRRKVAFEGGLLAGLRYTHFRDGAGECVGCQARPFGGLYAEVLQPSRTMAFYGELSLSSFRFRDHELVALGSTPSTDIYNTVAYGGWLATARIGGRFFHPLPRERQWFLGFGFELNRALGRTLTTLSGPPTTTNPDYLGYATPTFFPNLSLGWRNGRASLSLDGQMYRSSDDFWGSMFGSNVVLRLGASYRLGSNPDIAKGSR